MSYIVKLNYNYGYWEDYVGPFQKKEEAQEFCKIKNESFSTEIISINDSTNYSLPKLS